ncbi:hypothetical protein MUN88_02515 [Gracilibacillus caseinilyticus]|uniref:Uncharacterized protein n=1 Tax=Gracilibacillus caseinilyticus TaxID=2932256 RepID=A0ABY4F3K4_9BACI|nr:hypothetical protein [Gracilibacillus caseinilyticus]UOQ49031.1 hypothetical protein MUN88_02515 [Gracilibacillus caseinilyticus]
MSERALSLELNKNIHAKKASELSRNGILKNKRAFQCSDTNCRIDLTCTNWNKSGKKYFFTPSSKEELHILGCTAISTNEASEQYKKEADGAKSTIKKNGLIKMTESINKNTTDIKAKTEDLSANDNFINTNSSTTNKIRSESRQLYSIPSFVELYKDTAINNESQFILIDKSKISLNELFVKSKSTHFTNNKIRIFFGNALIKTASFGENMLQIEFLNSKLPKIYSNINKLSARPLTSKVLSYLDKNKYAFVYYRGKLIGNGTKFNSYNDKVYKDIFIK